MPLSSGARLGPYEIQSPLGAGGMGEVYRARDTRLDRTVAIKILPPHFSSDPVRKQRFDREARTISSLNHPFICVLHDVGQQDGIDYLVMECVEGETLAERLKKGPLPLDQILKYAAQIAEALDTAHRSGVIHRDLKPGNIMLTSSGVKLLDFGLAKPAAPLAAATTVTDRQLSPATAPGTIIGTFPYMSPEQVEGLELDARSDIFSFGAVVYEMLTGQRAFAGNTSSSVIAAILERSPRPVSALLPTSPPALDRIVKTCLAKNPDERWRSAADLRLQLDGLREELQAAPPPTAVQTPHFVHRIAWPLVLLFAAATAWLAALHFRPLSASPPLVRLSLLPPPGASFLPYSFAIAPDGSHLAFVALGPDGQTNLWVRGLASANAQQLSGTEGALYPFWSPDSLHIGFFAHGRLKTIELANSSVQNLCDAGSGFGGAWNRDGIIVFAPGITGPLYRIPAAGGNSEAVTATPAGSAESHHWPSFLPDGKHFLYYVNWSSSPDKPNGAYLGSLNSAADLPKLVSTEIVGNVFFASGNLLYVRDRTIMAQPFDASRLQTTGAAIPLSQQEVDKFFDFWQSSFSVSQNGTLVFQSALDAPYRLLWYDQAGKALGQFPEIGDVGPQFSPDGRSLAVYADDQRNGRHFIRVYDLPRGIGARVTEGGGESSPVWSHDGKFIAYRDSSLNIEEVPVDSSTPPRLLVKGNDAIPCDWSADGHLMYMNLSGGGPFPSLDVYYPPDNKSTQFLRFGAEAQFSPDGKWVAYIGVPNRQIVVQPFPGPGAHIQISNMLGSSQPRWSRDGKKIFYIQPDRKLMVADFDPVRNSSGTPHLITQTRIAVTSFGGLQYAVSPDGRFLINSLPATDSAPLTLVSGWPALLPHSR
jgi:serine/threonine protein kinase/Tol biopolymer transport system component